MLVHKSGLYGKVAFFLLICNKSILVNFKQTKLNFLTASGRQRKEKSKLQHLLTTIFYLSVFSYTKTLSILMLLSTYTCTGIRDMMDGRWTLSVAFFSFLLDIWTLGGPKDYLRGCRRNQFIALPIVNLHVTRPLVISLNSEFRKTHLMALSRMNAWASLILSARFSTNRLLASASNTFR